MPLPPDLLGRLYRNHAPALRLYARQWPGLTDDAVQEAFVRLAQQDPPPNRVLPWLYRTVRNAALAEQRSIWRRRRRENAVRQDEAWFSAADDVIDAQQAAQMLRELPLEEREPIVARLWGGLTFEEIAQLMDCSLPTAHRRYQAGLARLRSRLENSCRTQT